MRHYGLTRLTSLSWLCRVIVVLTAFAVCQGQTTQNNIPPPHSRIAEIYFGVIEPPVVAQGDITVRAPASNQKLEPLPLECSSMAWFDGRLLISSDRHQHLIFVSTLDLNKMTIGTPQPYVIIRNEQNLLDDAESLTFKRNPDGSLMVYALCSLSNDLSELPLPMRRHMLRFHLQQLEPFTFDYPVVFNAGSVRQSLNRYFQKLGVQPYRTYFADFAGSNKNTYRWGNVEGITFTPDGSRLMCGLRNPLFDNLALLFVISGVDQAFDAQDPSLLKVTDLFALDLGERGVSDLCWDPLTQGYLIAAAKSNGPKLDKDQPFPPNTLDAALFWWSGRKSEKPIIFARVPDMKIEAICRLGDSRFIAIGSDEGDVSEGRSQRQSVLTIMDFTAVPQP